MSALVALLATAALQAAQSTTTAPSPAPQMETTRKLGQSTYLDLEGGAGYSTNPRFSFSSHDGSGTGYLSLHAVHARITDRTTTLFSAFAQETAYTSHYGSSSSLSVSARHDAAVNEKLRLFVDANAGYDENGQLDTRIISVPNVPVLPCNSENLVRNIPSPHVTQEIPFRTFRSEASSAALPTTTSPRCIRRISVKTRSRST